MGDAIATIRGRVSDDGLRGLDRWFTRELRSTWPLDLALTLSAVLAVVTGAVVLWFHVIFVLVTVAALMLPFRGFVFRFVFWVATSVGLVLWAVAFRDTPSEELSELPLMSLILIIVYIGAQARARAVSDLEHTQQTLLDRTEVELDGLRHQLRQAQRLEMLARASTTMAHDLRNVFVVVGGAASELDPLLDDHAIAARAKEILDATDRGMAILGDLMTMGRRHDEIGQPIDLVAAIRQDEQLLRRLMPRHVALRISSTGEPIVVRIDRTSLLQIVMNLIVNSAEAITGSGEITISVQQVVRYQLGGAPPVAQAQLTVRDDGAGITAASIAEVFEPGFSTKPGDHSGLGLATVHQIVEHLNGTIELESSNRRGTSIRICLPLHEDRTERRALLVLGDAAARIALADELTDLGYAVMSAADRDEAQRVVDPHRPFTIAVLDEPAAGPGSGRELEIAADRVFVLDQGDGTGEQLPRTRLEATILLRRLLSPTRTDADIPGRLLSVVDSGESSSQQIERRDHGELPHLLSLARQP